MKTLEAMGEGESTTFVLPQELTSLGGRYGKHLTGIDVAGDGQELQSREFDAETRDLIGLDDITEILGEIEGAAEMNVEERKQEAEAVKTGKAGIKSADEVIQDVDGDDMSNIEEGADLETESG